MGKVNGKSNLRSRDLDLEHELPASEGEDANPEAEALQGELPANPVAGAIDSEIQKLKAERDMLVDRLARMQADFENARRRAAKEQEEHREYALADAVKALLPILDSFERAIQSAPPQAGDFRGGVELIYKQMQDSLAKLGLRPIPAYGETFDPHLHQAIEMVETTEAPDHAVIEELQRGYKFKERLLRPSMVRVAKNPKG